MRYETDNSIMGWALFFFISKGSRAVSRGWRFRMKNTPDTFLHWRYLPLAKKPMGGEGYLFFIIRDWRHIFNRKIILLPEFLCPFEYRYISRGGKKSHCLPNNQFCVKFILLQHRLQRAWYVCGRDSRDTSRTFLWYDTLLAQVCCFTCFWNNLEKQRSKAERRRLNEHTWNRGFAFLMCEKIT